MRIGIITHHWAYNFGANLQVFTLQKLLEARNHDVVVINYHPPDAIEKLYPSINPQQVRAHESFCDEHLKLSPILKSESEIINYCNDTKFDKIITGSDVVFRLSKKPWRADQKFPNPYWLTWIDKLDQKPGRIALAASSQGTIFFLLPIETQIGIHNALMAFDCITTRDKWTQWMVQWLSGFEIKPKIIPDPVFMFDEIDSIPGNLEHVSEPLSKKYILISTHEMMVSSEWINEFVAIAHKNNLLVFSLPLPEQEVQLPVDQIIGLPLSPFDWLNWIKNSSGYIGLRFHAVVTCLLFGIPFISFDNYAWRNIRTSSKTFDICKRVGLHSLCYDDKRRQKLSPAQAFKLLTSEKPKPNDGYLNQLKEQLRSTLDKIAV